MPPPLRVVIYRRLMMRIAERIARRHRAQALVTGEVVGQVASQTLENLTRINEVVHAAGAAAAVGMDKEEITARGAAARHLSDLDHSGSGLLHAVHAEASGDARPARSDVERAEASLPIEEMVDAGARRRGRGGLHVSRI